MPLNPKAKKIKEALDPYFSLLGMIGTCLGLVWSIYHFVAKPPDLSLQIQKQEINFPSSINNKFADLFLYLKDSTTNQKLLSDAFEIYKYLYQTDHFWRVTLRNETGKSLSQIRLRVSNVTSLNAWAVTSNYYNEKETNSILKKINFEEKSGMIFLEDMDELPSKAEVTFYFWGNMPKMLFDENVFASYDGGSARASNEIKVSGFQVYLVEYIYEILLVALLIFIGVYRHVIKKYHRTNTEANDGHLN